MIDIIIPVYNSKKTLSTALDSIVEQKNNPEISVYIVDDASDENYETILNNYKSNLDITFFRLDKNGGPGVARQKGIEISNNPYIIFLDSDDCFYNNNSVSNLYNAIIEKNADVVRSIIYEETDNGLVEYKNENIGLHGKIYKREFLSKNNISFNNTRSNEDTGFNYLLDLCGANYYYIDLVTYLWKNNYKSITRNNKKDYIDTDIECYSDNLLWAVNESQIRNYDKNRFSYICFDILILLFMKNRKTTNTTINKKVLSNSKKIYDILIKFIDCDIEKYIKDNKMYRFYNINLMVDTFYWLTKKVVKVVDDNLVLAVYSKEEISIRENCLNLLKEFNNLPIEDYERRRNLEEKMFSFIGHNTEILPPLNANWGCKNVTMGSGCYVNVNLTLVDDGNIIIGNNVLFGPNVTISTVNHPVDVQLRLNHYIEIKDVTIKDNAWIGANSVILPGITIGKNSVIGAGSIVTKDIPDNVLAYGNPCKIIKKIDE